MGYNGIFTALVAENLAESFQKSVLSTSRHLVTCAWQPGHVLPSNSNHVTRHSPFWFGVRSYTCIELQLYTFTSPPVLSTRCYTSFSLLHHTVTPSLRVTCNTMKLTGVLRNINARPIGNPDISDLQEEPAARSRSVSLSRPPARHASLNHLAAASPWRRKFSIRKSLRHKTKSHENLTADQVLVRIFKNAIII